MVVGSGWYGCRVAEVLQRRGEEFVILDESGDFFAGSSSKNQNRLHLGFHYPRCSRTRSECVAGYRKFIDSGYPCRSIRNLYAVAKKSLVDRETYCLVYRAEGAGFEEAPLSDVKRLTGMELDDGAIEGPAIACDEKYIDFEACARMFRAKFGDRLRGRGEYALDLSDPGRPSLDGEPVEHVFDCTYGQLVETPFRKKYEVCVTLVCRLLGEQRGPEEAFAFTVMDGPFFSIYPYAPERGLYTVTHVSHTPLRCFGSASEAREYMGGDRCASDCARARRDIERACRQIVLNFDDLFAYDRHFVSMKTKPTDTGSDDRSLRVHTRGRATSFIGGKITGVFEVDHRVSAICESRSNLRRPGP